MSKESERENLLPVKKIFVSRECFKKLLMSAADQEIDHWELASKILEKAFSKKKFESIEVDI